jgi:hypothetical protein
MTSRRLVVVVVVVVTSGWSGSWKLFILDPDQRSRAQPQISQKSLDSIPAGYQTHS